MSEPMKKHPINGVKIQIGEKRPRFFVLSKKEANGLVQMLSRYEVTESVDWRETFKPFLEKSPEGGIALKAERTIAGMTQVALAKKIGIPQHVVSEMESGKRPIGKKMAGRLAKVFKTDYRIFL